MAVAPSSPETASAPESPSASPPPESSSASSSSESPATTKQVSGTNWVSKFPGSNSLDDLEPTFRENVEKFIKAIKDAGGKVKINATYRPPERAYLMHWSWKIVNENYDPQKVPTMAGVNINWSHGDLAKSKKAAQEMVDGYGINNLHVAPSLTSHHTEHQGKTPKATAIDMKISWTGDLKIKEADGAERKITSTPRDGTNKDLIEVGKMFSVIHFKSVDKDKPHWSIDGK